MQYIDELIGVLFGILGVYLIYNSIVLKKADIGELFTTWILKYKYNWIVTFLLLISISMYVYDMNVAKQRYDELYEHKENILNELLSQGKNTECDTILYYSLDEVSPEAMFVDTAIVDNPSVIIHCNGFWNRLKGTSTAKKGQSLHGADVYVNGKKLRKKSVCVDFY